MRALRSQRSRNLPASPRAWLLLLVLLALTVGGKAPPGTGPALPPGVEPAAPEQLGTVCPAYDASELPSDLPVGATASAGSTPGSFAVSAAGAATYSIPLVVPPGRLGMEPSLSIAYDSGGGEGLLGAGFSLGGLSAVTRCPATLAQDGFIRAVRIDKDDHYCLDGLRLVPVSTAIAPDGGETRELRTFPDTFAKVIAYHAAGADPDRGPERWEVFTKSGRIVEYGSNANSRAMATQGKIAGWWVRRERDRRENAIVYTYDNTKAADGHTTEIVPLEIGYAHGAGYVPTRVVSFVTEPASAPSTHFQAGMKLRRTKVLSRIDMKLGSGGATVRSYRLHHEPSEGTGRDLLRSIEECAGAGPCKPATRFSWSSHVDYGPTAHETPLLLPGYYFGPNTAKQWTLADVNGDGLEDIVLSYPNQDDSTVNEWWVARNRGGSFEDPERWLSMPYPGLPVRWNMIAMDYDQDGLTDILLDADDLAWFTFPWLRAKPGGGFELRDTGVVHPPALAVGGFPWDHERFRFMRLGDVNGDGVADLIQCVNMDYDSDDPKTRRWTVNLWSPALSGFDPEPKTIPFVDGVVDCAQGKRNVHVADTDGDGRAELIVPFEGETYGAIRHVAGDAWESAPLNLPREYAHRFARLHFMSARGDGLPDVVVTGYGHGGCYTYNGFYLGSVCGPGPTSSGPWSADLPFLFTNTGQGFADIQPTLPGQLVPGDWTDYFGDAATPVDWNGDGRMDLIMPVFNACGDPPLEPAPDACWVVLQSSVTGEGHMTPIITRIPAVADPHVHFIPDHFQLRVTDVNGDGRQDVIVADRFDAGRLRVYTSSGPQDVLTSITEGMSPLDPGDPGHIPTVEINYGSLVDSTVTRGFSPSSVEYDDELYAARSDPKNGCAYPRACVTGVARVVSYYSVNDGQNGQRTFYMRYRDGRYDRRGRGFLGFRERITLDADTGAGTIERYDNITYFPGLEIYPYAGQVVHSAAWSNERANELDPGRVEVTFTDRTFSIEAQNGTYFTLPTKTVEKRESGTMVPGKGKTVRRYVRAAEAQPLNVIGEATREVQSFDDYGNVLYESHAITGADLGGTVVRSVENDPAAWLLGLVTFENACSSAMGMTQCRGRTLEYNDLGEVESVEIGDSLDPGTQLSMTLGRDGYGNVIHTSASDAFGHHRAACVSYDADGIFPYAARNAVGHLTFAKHEPGVGAMTASIDENGLVTQWTHDGFGRMTEERRPDGTRTTVSLARNKQGGPNGNWWRTLVTTKEDGGADSVAELDSLGRPIRTLTAAAVTTACGASVCQAFPTFEQKTTYDSLGRVTRVTLPWLSGDSLSGKLRHDYEYDASGRLTKHTEPWGRVTTFTHTSLVTLATDWLGTTAAHTDALGRVVKVVDKKGYETKTSYGPFGLPRATVRLGSEINMMEQDAYGRIVVEHDPDRGVTETSYSGFGDVLTLDDANGRHYDFRHDGLGRMIERDDPDGVTRWTYDVAAHGKGRIAKIENQESVKENTYDALSRLATTALTLDGETFQAKLFYDDKSRLQRIDYPTVPGVAPVSVFREYDARGNLIRVKSSAYVSAYYWQLESLDGAGRGARESFGSGASTQRDHVASMGLTQRIQTTVGGSKLQDLVYTYDKGLRMLARSDQLQAGPKGVRTELFTHDELGRLTCSRFTDVPIGQDITTSGFGPRATSVQYHPNGNIAYKSGVGTYTYDPAHPHAVRIAGFASFVHDAVGNQIARPGASTTYTAFDLPRAIQLDTTEVLTTFAYDGDQQRIRKRSAEGETVYFEDLYERVKVGTDPPVHRFYIAAGSATVVLTRKAAAGISLAKDGIAYLHPDALGSTDLVTDGAGKVLERQSYDAFGARRNPKWSPAFGPVAYTSKVSSVGFTGHESDEDLGLINMRGRIYDPKLGRFLSTDPIVSAPHFGQSWNPYSYVHNSPLNFVDPSGFQEAPPPPKMPEGCDSTCQFRDGSWYKPISATVDGRTRTTLHRIIDVKDAARDDAASRASAHDSVRRRFEDSTPILLFFLPIPQQYVRPYQAPPAGAPVGLAALRQLNGQPGVGVANFSRDYAPGTHVRNLVLQSMDVLAAGVSAAVPLAGVLSRALSARRTAAAASQASPKAVACPECALEAACFVAGTGVLTPTGVRAIDSLQPGDLVVTRNTSVAGVPEWRTVEAACTEEPDPDAAYRAFDGTARLPRVDDVVVVLADAWAPAERVKLADARIAARVAFQGIVYETRRSRDHLEIRETGETLQYVRQAIRRTAAGLVEVVVRSGRGEHHVVGTAEHPFYVPARRGFVPMGELAPGMGLLGEGGDAAEVVAVEARAASSEVFNVEVDRTHAYFVCDGEVDGRCELVHNGGPCFQRPLTPADLGVEGTDAIVQGTFRLKNGQAIVKVDYLASPGKQLAPHVRAILPRLKELARASGATKLRVETSYIIEMTGGLERFLVRFGFQARNNGTMFLEVGL